jgi:hypothetical protein
MSSSQTLGLGLLCLLFFGVGIVALGWPEKLQEWALNFYGSGSGLAKWNPFLNWMRTSSYVVSLRIVGFLALVAGCLVLLAITRAGSF